MFLSEGRHVSETDVGPILQIVIDQGNKEGYQAVMEARDQLLLLGRTTSSDLSPAASAPVGSLMVEDEQTGEVRPISKKERQRLKKDARKAKKELQSQAGRKSPLRTEGGKEVVQIGNEIFYEEEKAGLLSDPASVDVEGSEEPGVIGSHVVAPVRNQSNLRRPLTDQPLSSTVPSRRSMSSSIHERYLSFLTATSNTRLFPQNQAFR